MSLKALILFVRQSLKFIDKTFHFEGIKLRNIKMFKFYWLYQESERQKRFQCFEIHLAANSIEKHEGAV